MTDTQAASDVGRVIYYPAQVKKSPTHHLFLQSPGKVIYWIALSFRTTDGTIYRVRRSLATKNLQLAKKRRNAILRDLAVKYGIYAGEHVTDEVRQELIEQIIREVEE